MIVLSYNLKGGVGKSTLVCNTAVLCADKGIPAVVIDGDLQRNTSCFLAELGKTEYSKGRTFDYGSVKVGEDVGLLEENNKLILVDAPPALRFVSEIPKVDVILIPVDGLWAADGSVTVIADAKKVAPNARIIVWYNKAYDSKFSKHERKQLAEEFGIVELFKLPVPASENFERSVMLNLPVWKVPYSSRSVAVQNFKLLCEFVSNGCPDGFTYESEDLERAAFSSMNFKRRRDISV